MDENLVGYLLKSLDAETHRQVEDYLRDNPSARQRLDRLRRVLTPLSADAEPPEPSSGLWIRTLAHIAQDRCRSLPPAPRPMTARTASASRWRWRRADLLVAASILILLGGLTVSGLGHLKQLQGIKACENNLREIHGALVRYSNLHGRLPEVKEQAPHNFAGIFVPCLNDHQFLKNTDIVACPGDGSRAPTARSMQDLETLHKLDPKEFRRVIGEVGGSYAYSLGYREQDGNGPVRGWRLDDRVPIMADRPPFDAGAFSGGPGNSRNHGGRGQNVLYIGGNVAFLKDRAIGSDDIYLNKERRIGAGIGRDDAVLGSSWASP